MIQLRIFVYLSVFFILNFNIKANPIIGNPGYTSSACSPSSRTFTVNISDPSGIASGSLSPRAYYRVNSGPYSSVSGTLTSGTFTNGIWTFSMTYSASSNDFIYFFITAQNSLSSISANPSSGFSATDVNSIISYPNIPFGYFTSSLNGTYNIGASGNFKTLYEAALAYSSSCNLLGPVTFVLTDTAYKPSTGEIFPIIFGFNYDASPTYSLLIKPAIGVNVNITTDVLAHAAIKFRNAKYFTLDGSNGTGNGISIHCPSTTTLNAACVYLANNANIYQGCRRGVVKNLNLFGSNAAAGIYVGQDSPTAGWGDADSIYISSNLVQSAAGGIFAAGLSSLFTLNNISIVSNTVGPVASSPTINCIYGQGIGLTATQQSLIDKNLIQNCLGGIGMQLGINATLTVSENTIRSITGSPGNGYANGINSIGLTSKGVFKNNTISSISNLTQGQGARGISFLGGTDNSFQNNMISDVYCLPSATSFTTWPIGIYMYSPVSTKFENNSIHLSGTHTSTTGNLGSAAFMIDGPFSFSNQFNTLKNNIFSNTYDHSGTLTDTAYAIFSKATPNYISSTDNNVYYVGGTGNPVPGWLLNTKLNSLANIQSAWGGDLNSYSVAPVFIALNDPHLVTSANPAMDNNGTPIAGLTTDVDNQIRNSIAPDIGADEFTNPSPCTTSIYGKIYVDTITACSGQTVALNFIGGGSGTGFTYQWKASTSPSGPYTNVVGGIGATTTSYTSATLTTGTYYYVLEKTCTSASMTTISNEATVTIKPTPTATATSSSYTVCPGKLLYLFGATDIGTTFNWVGPGTFSSTTQNTGDFPQTSSGSYYFTATLNGCTSLPASVSFSLHPYYQMSITVSPSTVVCAGTSVTITASGAATYTFGSPPWIPVTVSSSIVVIPPGPLASYTVKSTDINNCFSGGALGYLDIYWQPSITSVTNILCSGQTTTLNVINAASTYTWNTGPTTSSIIVSPSVTTTYSATGTTTDNCNYTAAATITVSTCTTIHETGYQDLPFSISPNPNSGNFMVSIKPDIYNGRLKLFNVLGQLILEQEIISDKTEVHLIEPPLGIYYFTFENDKQQIYSGKFLIE